MSVKKGDLIILQVGGVQLGALVGNNYNEFADMLDKSNKDTPGVKQYEAGEDGWTLSVEALYDPAATEGFSEALGYLKAGTEVTVLHGDPNDVSWTGQAFISSIDLSGPKNEISSYSLELQGTGVSGAASGAETILADGDTIAWFDMAEAYVTKDGGNLVSQWSDRSGNDNHLTQATGADQPLWSASGILFDGVSDFMQTAAMSESQPITIYAVINPKTWTNGDRILDPLSTTGWLYQSGSTPDVISSMGTPSGANSDLTVDTFAVVRIVFNGASSKLQVNTEAAVTGDFGPGSMNGLTLARRGGTAVSWGHVEFKEIIIRDVEDTGADQTAIYNYLVDKYSL
jgi:hypothetical protein